MSTTTNKKNSTMNIDLRMPALNWINGEWVDSVQHTESINPATGEAQEPSLAFLCNSLA